MHHIVLEQQRTDAEEDRDRDVLHQIAGAPIDLVAVAALVERAQGDANQRDRGREPAPARLAAHRPVVQDQQNAAEAERKAGPLQRRDALAEPAVGNRRGHDRLQARDQRREPGRNRMRDRDRSAAKIEPVHEDAGNRAVKHAGAVRPFRPRDRNDDPHQQNHDRHADREIAEGIGVVDDVFGGDEARAPEHDKHRGRRTRGEFLRFIFHCRPDCPNRGNPATANSSQAVGPFGTPPEAE